MKRMVVYSFSRKTAVYLFLSMFFVANTLIAEFVGVKMFSLDQLFGLSSGAMNMSVGVLLWPLGFILTDIVNEYYGPRGVRSISFIAAGMILWSFIIVQFAIALPAASFWVDINKSASNGFDSNLAYASLLGASSGIMIGSVTAFLVSQFIDAYLFQWLRNKVNNKFIWLRAIGSTLVSQVIDSFVILFIAFGIFGSWSVDQIVSVGITQYIYKVCIALLLTPLLYVAHYFIDRYFKNNDQDPTSIDRELPR